MFTEEQIFKGAYKVLRFVGSFSTSVEMCADIDVTVFYFLKFWVILGQNMDYFSFMACIWRDYGNPYRVLSKK